jgi:hypothetical protein
MEQKKKKNRKKNQLRKSKQWLRKSDNENEKVNIRREVSYRL